MKKNMGKTDKTIRLILGVVIIALGIYFKSWWGLVGLVPLLTALVSFCPLYAPCKFSSIKKETWCTKCFTCHNFYCFWAWPSATPRRALSASTKFSTDSDTSASRIPATSTSSPILVIPTAQPTCSSLSHSLRYLNKSRITATRSSRDRTFSCHRSSWLQNSKGPI